MTEISLRERSSADVKGLDVSQCAGSTVREDRVSSGIQNTSNAFLILLLIVVLPLSGLSPPFQSPDEFNHVKRAYLLSSGHVFLERNGGETGGYINSGLLDYMDIFMDVRATYHQKVTQKMLRESKRIDWSAEKRFSGLPNTAVYFPFSYTPQAMAFFVGERIRLSVNDTYYLARVLSLFAAIAVLWVATRVYPVPLVVHALFATPMVLFQLGTASLDAISFSMCVLVAALFMRAADKRLPFSRTMHITLIGCLLLLATARANLVGMVWVPLVLYSIRRTRWYLVSTILLIALCVSWTAFVALTVEGGEIQHISPADILAYYLRHIDQFMSVLYATIVNREIILSYWRMFIGVLGWIDTPLDWIFYWIFSITLAMMAIISVRTDTRILLSRERLSLALGAVLSTLLLFVIFLATYTLHPAKFVGAIQGRYFYPTAIFLGFAFFDRPLSQRQSTIGTALLFFSVALSAASMAPKLIGRYWAS